MPSDRGYNSRLDAGSDRSRRCAQGNRFPADSRGRFCRTRRQQYADRQHQVQLAAGMSPGQRLISPKDLLVAVPDNKNVVEERRGQHIDHAGKNAGLHPRLESRMPPKMQVHRCEEQQPSSETKGEQIQSLKTGIENWPVLARSIEIAIDVKIEIVNVL